jgi:hypothetical protein
MPHLNKFDDYDECMDVYKDQAKYCYVRSAIKPDGNSEIYKFIAEFSSNVKQHFRHDRLTRGVCINSCAKLIINLDSDANSYYQPDFDNISSSVLFLFD